MLGHSGRGDVFLNSVQLGGLGEGVHFGAGAEEDN